MKVLKVSPEDSKELYYKVELDNNVSVIISAITKFKYGIYEGLTLTDDEVSELILHTAFCNAKNDAIKYLAYRKRSKKEVSDLLRRKSFDPKTIDETIDFLIINKYLNDLDFATSYAKDKANINLLGPERIRYELHIKGIDEDLIEKALLSIKDIEFSNAMKLTEKKYSNYLFSAPLKSKNKMTSFLVRKGYSYDTIRQVFQRLDI